MGGKYEAGGHAQRLILSQIWAQVLVREDQVDTLDPPLGLESAFW
jgi:hypothetical protein